MTSDGVYPLYPDSLVPLMEMYSDDLGARRMESLINVLPEEALHHNTIACDGAHDQAGSLSDVAPMAERFPAGFSQAMCTLMLPALPWDDDESIIGRREHDAFLNALGNSFPACEERKAPGQSTSAAHITLIDANDTEPLVPDLSSVSSPQVDIGMDTIIGTIRLSGDIRCQHLGCASTFGRLTELRRHYTEFHAVNKPEFWCNEPTCGRSYIGGRPFHRRDKMRDHERKVHHRGIHRKRR